MLLGLRSAFYPVDDMAAARDWYGRCLECEPYFDSDDYIGFAVGGFELGSFRNATAATEGTQAAWGVADADAALARLIQLGATTLEAVCEVGGGIKVAAVRDPFGNRLSIIENPLFDHTQVG